MIRSSTEVGNGLSFRSRRISNFHPVHLPLQWGPIALNVFFCLIVFFFCKGFGVSQLTTRHGKRSSTFAAFLADVVAVRPNLHAATHSLVEKILIDDAKRARGVQFRRHGRQLSVGARKEIVLSAGAIGSPQILMLSGVGPRQHLESLGVLSNGSFTTFLH